MREEEIEGKEQYRKMVHQEEERLRSEREEQPEPEVD